jgi:hypothetical protein
MHAVLSFFESVNYTIPLSVETNLWQIDTQISTVTRGAIYLLNFVA